MSDLVMLSLRAVATASLHKNVWTMVAEFKWYRLSVIDHLYASKNNLISVLIMAVS